MNANTLAGRRVNKHVREKKNIQDIQRRKQERKLDNIHTHTGKQRSRDAGKHRHKQEDRPVLIQVKKDINRHPGRQTETNRTADTQTSLPKRHREMSRETDNH